MFVDLEQSLIDTLRGVIPGAQMYGTFEAVDVASEDVPHVAVRVSWLGFPPQAQRPNALAGSHQFAIEVMVDGLRVMPAEQKRIADGITTIYQRLAAWRPHPDMSGEFAEIEAARVSESGAVFQYQINLTVPGYVIRPVNE
ncbi:MAG TPA: hypothetical protein PLN31_19620 [Azoarcus taiwanensis]|nr:hypothetical protein [Azoarcus taiwanensis]